VSLWQVRLETQRFLRRRSGSFQEGKIAARLVKAVFYIRQIGEGQRESRIELNRFLVKLYRLVKATVHDVIPGLQVCKISLSVAGRRPLQAGGFGRGKLALKGGCDL